MLPGVPGPAHVTELPGPVSGPWFAGPRCPWPVPFPPRPPPWLPGPAVGRQSFWLPLFGRFVGTMARSDSLRPCVMVVSVWCTMRALRRWARPDAGPPESRSPCVRACQGSSTPPGACTPCPSGVPAVAFRVCGARRHPGRARLRGSIPCRHVPLSTLHGPRYRGSRMTRGQRGGRDLRCRRLTLLHIVPVCLGTPERWRSAAPGSGSVADAGRRRLQCQRSALLGKGSQPSLTRPPPQRWHSPTTPTSGPPRLAPPGAPLH